MDSSMNNTLYISVFGLNLNVINEIKSNISNKLAKNITIHWTHIADSKLQVLLINDDFIDLPNITKIKHNRLIILKLKKNESHANKIEHDTLFLPLTNPTEFENWLVNTVLTQTCEQLQNNILQPIVKDVEYKLNYQQFSNLYAQINNHQRLLILLDKSPIGLIDNINNEFWIKSQIKILQKSELTLIPADTNTVVNFKYSSKSVNLQHGLWQFVWDYVGYETLAFSKHYKLLHWPQPIDCIERKSLLKMSAFFMEGSSTQYVAEKMQLSQNFINRFLFACDIANMIEEIPAMATVFHTQQVVEESSKPLLHFFRSLREKLGI